MRSFLINGLRNLWYWLPIIWRDRPWDYVYLLKIIKHKVEEMEANTPEWFSVNAEDIRVEMQDMIKVIDDLLSDRAEMDAHIAHERIFGPSKHTMVEQPGSDQLPGGPFYEYEIIYPEADNQEVARRTLISFMEIATVTHGITMEAFGRAMMSIDRWWD